jgi:benzodiazapine receptor
MKTKQILKLLISISFPLILGGIAGSFTAGGISDWYQMLNKPSFNPPGWIFGPVWTILYLIMGYSLYLIWNQNASKKRNIALGIFLLQQILNFAWSFLFFYFGLIGWALVEIIVLWISIVVMLALFYKIKPQTAYINIPYLLWVSFATLLNASFYVLN